MYPWTPASFSPLATNDNSGNSPVFQHVLWCYVFCTLLQVVFKTLYNSFIDVVEAQIAVVDIGIKIFLVSLNAFLMICFFCLFGICLIFVQWAVYLAIARLSWLVEVVCLLLCMAAMGKVRPFCRSGLEANILQPSWGLLSEKFCHHHGLEFSCHLLTHPDLSDYAK